MYECTMLLKRLALALRILQRVKAQLSYDERTVALTLLACGKN